jgi:hypothetical protein
LWERIKLQGTKEGLSEKELAEMARPYLKQRGLSKDKIYYLFHREEQIERVRRRKITTMTAKSIPIKSSTITKFGKKENVVHFQELLSSSNPDSVIINAKQVDVIEFNLVEALNMGLRDAINMIDTAKGCVCIVKIYVKDGIVIKVGRQYQRFYEGDLFGMKPKCQSYIFDDILVESKLLHEFRLLVQVQISNSLRRVKSCG